MNVNQKFLERIQELTEERDQLQAKNHELQQLVSRNKNTSAESSGELLHLKNFVKMMNNSSLQLDEILSKGKVFGDVSRLG